VDLACRTGAFSTALADVGAHALGIEGRQVALCWVRSCQIVLVGGVRVIRRLQSEHLGNTVLAELELDVMPFGARSIRFFAGGCRSGAPPVDALVGAAQGRRHTP
jgi:hypothetical protein